MNPPQVAIIKAAPGFLPREHVSIVLETRLACITQRR
jgi:hypothetical protein